MCAPSVSASDKIITLWNFKLSKSKSAPIPVPKAEIIVLISSFLRTSSSLFFTEFSGLPRSGNIAW